MEAVARSGTLAWWRSPWTMVSVAFVVRVALVRALHTYQIPAANDHYLFGAVMGRIARSLATGHGFASPFGGQTGPTAMVGPVYPLIIAAVFKALGVYTVGAAATLLVLSALFSALTAAVVYLVGRESFGEPAGVWAAWVWVFFPLDIFWAILWVWDTALSALLFAATFLAMLRAARGMGAAGGIRLGLLWGITALANTTFLSLLPFLVVWLCVELRRRGRAWLRPAGMLLAGVVIVLAPWVVRNYSAFGHVLLRSNFGLELEQGNSPGATVAMRALQHYPAYSEAEFARYRALGEYRYMAAKQEEAMAYIRRDPGAFAHTTGLRVVFFWLLEAPVWMFNFPRVVYALTSLVAWCGLVAAVARRHPAAAPILIVALIFPLVYYVTHPEARFRCLIDPELFAPMGWAIAAAAAQGRRWLRLGTPLLTGGRA